MNTSTYTIINNSSIRHTLFLLYVLITTPHTRSSKGGAQRAIARSG